MAPKYDYKCSRCQTPTARDKLVVKKAGFSEMGVGARTLRSRVVAWLCDSCVRSDPDWNREKNMVPISA